LGAITIRPLVAARTNRGEIGGFGNRPIQRAGGGHGTARAAPTRGTTAPAGVNPRPPPPPPTSPPHPRALPPRALPPPVHPPARETPAPARPAPPPPPGAPGDPASPPPRATVAPRAVHGAGVAPGGVRLSAR